MWFGRCLTDWVTRLAQLSSSAFLSWLECMQPKIKTNFLLFKSSKSSGLSDCMLLYAVIVEVYFAWNQNTISKHQIIRRYAQDWEVRRIFSQGNLWLLQISPKEFDCECVCACRVCLCLTLSVSIYYLCISRFLASEVDESVLYIYI